MGLSIDSQDGKREIWFGGYHAFWRFRSELFALVVGGGQGVEEIKKQYLDIYNDCHPFKPGIESRFKVHPGLRQFMMHSDHDGYWSPKTCGRIAEMLASVLEHFETGGRVWGISLAAVRMFVHGLKYCEEKNIKAKFH